MLGLYKLSGVSPLQEDWTSIGPDDVPMSPVIGELQHPGQLRLMDCSKIEKYKVCAILVAFPGTAQLLTADAALHLVEVLQLENAVIGNMA